MSTERDEIGDAGPDFVWGASTASYQIEGAVKEDGRGPSVWDIFSHTPGKIKNNDTGDVACDHYHRMAEDVDLLKRGGFNAYRFSVAWPRVLPAGIGAVNPKGLDFYDRLVDALIARGITPWVCLYHWDLPQALQERGGWLNREIAPWFADYAGIVAARLGDRVKHWIMFNEAAVHGILGYGNGIHAPGVTGLENAIAALHHQNLAQGMALQALRAERRDWKLGTVMILHPVRALSERPEDRAAAVRYEAIWKRSLIDPLFKGSYPDVLASHYAKVVRDGDLAVIRQPIDFLGVNYYYRSHVGHVPGRLLDAGFRDVAPGTPLTAMGWTIEPQGLYEQLIELRDHYGNPDMVVTENGAAFDDVVAADGSITDPDRIAYLREHIRAALNARRDGAALRGYFVWSLMDNFEWAEGLSKRFGLIHVDYRTLKRTPKASFDWFAKMASP